jgi:hypothetical protein
VGNTISLLLIIGGLAVAGGTFWWQKQLAEAKLKRENAAKRKAFLALAAPEPKDTRRKRQPQFGRRT